MRAPRLLAKPFAFLLRDFLQEASYRLAFASRLVGIFISTAMFFFLAKTLGTAVSPYLERYGGSYFAFVLTGLAFGGYLNVAVYGIPDIVRQAQVTGTLEALVTTRTSLPTIVFCSSLYDFLQATVNVVLYLGIGALAFQLRIHAQGALLAVVILILTVLAFTGIGVLMASFVIIFKQGNPLMWIVGQASWVFGGVFFPVAVLPGWLRGISQLIPLTHALEGMRIALLRPEAMTDAYAALAKVAAFAVVLVPLSLWVFTRAIRMAEERGTLAQF